MICHTNIICLKWDIAKFALTQNVSPTDVIQVWLSMNILKTILFITVLFCILFKTFTTENKEAKSDEINE